MEVLTSQTENKWVDRASFAVRLAGGACLPFLCNGIPWAPRLIQASSLSLLFYSRESKFHKATTPIFLGTFMALLYRDRGLPLNLVTTTVDLIDQNRVLEIAKELVPQKFEDDVIEQTGAEVLEQLIEKLGKFATVEVEDPEKTKRIAGIVRLAAFLVETQMVPALKQQLRYDLGCLGLHVVAGGSMAISQFGWKEDQRVALRRTLIG